MQEIIILYVILIAFLAGFIGSILGLGGGSILVPFLDMLADAGFLPGVNIHQIIATSLVCTIATSSTSSSIYIEKKITNMRIGIFLGTISILGAFTGATISVMLQGNILRFLFGILLIFTAYNMIKGKRYALKRKEVREDKLARLLGLNGEYYDESEKKTITYQAQNTLKGFILTFFGGLVSGLLGIGGGVINVPILILILGLPPKVASATSLFIIGLNGATGGTIYWLSGLIEPLLVAPAVLGIFIGATTGTKFFRKLRNETLRKIFAIFLLYVALRMIYKAFY